MKYQISLEPIEKKPREKLLQHGPDVLSNAELMAIIFVTGTKNESVFEIASRCLKEYGSRSITNVRDVSKTAELLGIGLSRASQLVAAFELGRRFFKEDTGRMPYIRGPEDIYKYYKYMASLKREEVRAIYLNSRQRVIHEELLSIGGVDRVAISPAVVLQPAIELMCKSIILVHNHPSGELEPSREDIDFTRQVRSACEILGVSLLDHIIIAEGYQSIDVADER